MKYILAAMLMAGACSVLANSTMTLTSVTAQQRYPWNGNVDIVVTIQGDTNEIAQTECAFFATNSETQTAVCISSLSQKDADSYSGDTCTRRYLWSALNDIGAVKIDNLALTVSVVQSLGGVQLWENGPYWAECNVGATEPEEYGYYFWWGDPFGCERNASNNGWVSACDGLSKPFSSCPTHGKNDWALKSAGYIDSSGNLVAIWDGAAVKLGVPWRMPTMEEFGKLYYWCTTTWTMRKGVSGLLVTGNGAYSSKSIFLPAAGFGYDASLGYAGSKCYYWSSTRHSNSPNYAWSFYGDSSDFDICDRRRYYGQPIRPLREFPVVVDAGVAAHLVVDCRMGTHAVSPDGETLYYDAEWYDNATTVSILVDGTEIGSGTKGALQWNPGWSFWSHTLELRALASDGTVVGTEKVEFDRIGDAVTVGGVVPLAYSPLEAGVCELTIDGASVLATTNAGTFVWYPRETGTHTLAFVSGTNRVTCVADVTALAYEPASAPNPPGSEDETIALTSTEKTFTSTKRSAGTFSVTSTTGTGTWEASASDDWITLSKTSGTVGTDKVAYIVAANTNAQSRTGYVYVSGHVHTVVQPGTGVEISMENLSVGHQGVEQAIAIDTTVDGAPWYARPENQWISVRPTSGCGDGNVTVQVAPYFVVGMREGSATIAGKTVTIVQRGRDMQLANETTNVTAATQSVLVDVKALEDVSWSVVSGADWVTISSAVSGLGNSAVDLSIAANTSYLPRTATVSIGTETFTVTQAGTTALTFEIAATAVEVSAKKTAAKTLKITATPDLPWTVTSDSAWLQPIERYKSGAGTATIAYSVAANPSLAARAGILTITPAAASGLAAKTLTVTQAAAVSSVDKTDVSVTADATTSTIAVTVDAGVVWSVASASNWVTFEGSGSRTGAGDVVLHIAENTSIVAREGTVTIAGHTVTVRQAGGTIGISMTKGEVAAAGGTIYVDVTGSANLNWTVQNVASWVTVEGDVSRKGPASLVIRVAANTGTVDRSCEILLGGQKLIITQKAAGTEVVEDVLSYGSDTDFGSFDVTAPDYLTWTTTTTNEWIILTSDESTTGHGTVEYIVDETDEAASRIGIIWVGTTPVYVCQCGFDVTLGETAKEVSRVSGNGQIAIDVDSDEDEWCAESTEDWIKVLTRTGVGSGVVQYSYEDNTTGVARVGRILVGNQVFTLTQTAVDPSAARWNITYENLQGAANGNADYYYEGFGLVFVALPNVSNFTFVGWTPTCIASDASGDKTVTANWNWVPSDGIVEAAITGGKPMDIKADWAKKELTQRFGAGKDQAFREKFGADFAAALIKPTGKRDGAGQELAVWHDYVAGTDPTDSNSVFRAKLEMKNGLPVVEWEPNLNSNGEERVYTIWGKTNLTDSAWHTPTNECSKFFKVDVAMPAEGTVSFNLGGACGAIDSANIRIGEPIGDLPTPTRSNYQFLGWFTEAEGGTEITSDTIVTADMTIYAHWKSNALVHRWSFNGNLTDSVGGQTAQAYGTISFDSGECCLPGGARGIGYVDLGANIVQSADSPLTIEVWARLVEKREWSRILEIGTDAKNYLSWLWCKNSSSFDSDAAELYQSGTAKFSMAPIIAPFKVGVLYHLSLKVEPNYDGEGTVRLTWAKRDAITGLVVANCSADMPSSWSLFDFPNATLFLGHSQHTGTGDANASYNELRVWNRALSEAELTASAKAGPDADL